MLTVSENSKRELLDLYRISDKKTFVIYNGWQHMLSINEDSGIFKKLGIARDEEYYYSLGSILEHKNFAWIINAAKQNPDKKFVVTGSASLNTAYKQMGLDDCDNVLFTGYLSDGEIKSLMTHCRAFIHPSFYEGFGIPPLEALSLGARIVVANASCLPEIFGNSACYLNPYQTAGISIEAILNQKYDLAEKTLMKYSWEKSALLLSQAFSRVENINLGVN